MQRGAQSDFRREGEAPSVSSAGEDPAQNNLNKSQTTERLPATGEFWSVATAGEYPVQSNQQNSGVPQKKEAERIECEKFPKSVTRVIWK